jgi:hypothetical protein
MVVSEYDDVTFTFNGHPLVLGREATSPKAGYACSFSCVVESGDFDRLAEMFDTIRAEPARPTGTALVPFGILGSLPVTGGVDLRADGDGVSGAMDVDERAWRRTLSMAVQRAITTGFSNGRDGTSVAITAWLHGETPLVREMGAKIAYGRGCAYRGARKRRKAMRRLLRAAGVTTPW